MVILKYGYAQIWFIVTPNYAQMWFIQVWLCPNTVIVYPNTQMWLCSNMHMVILNYGDTLK